MDCPRCFEEGTLAQRAGDPTDRCDGCQGVWIPPETAHWCFREPFGRLAELPLVSVGAALRCPCCGGELERRQAAMVEIDVCPAHGVWLDRSELEYLLDGPRARESGPAPLAVSGGASVVVEVASIYGPPATTTDARSVGGGMDLKDVQGGLEGVKAVFELIGAMLEGAQAVAEGLSSLND